MRSVYHINLLNLKDLCTPLASVSSLASVRVCQRDNSELFSGRESLLSGCGHAYESHAQFDSDTARLTGGCAPEDQALNGSGSARPRSCL
jgi:hypothetical protein